MRKNSDYSANNQLLTAKNDFWGELFCKTCDFCPFLGDFSDFCQSLRQGVGQNLQF